MHANLNRFAKQNGLPKHCKHFATKLTVLAENKLYFSIMATANFL